MHLNNCCYKALKHHETSCPVCGTEFFKPRCPDTDVEKDGQTVLLFQNKAQLVIDFNQHKR